VSVNDILTITENAKLIAYGDISANDMYVSGNLTVVGSFIEVDIITETVQDLTVTNDASFNDVTVNGTFTTNSTVAINDGATIVGDLNCTASTIIQW
jgi:cytoskeletal protein CcmA (bactofilin family)